MFNKDFYPTPADVIEQMLYGFDATGKVVLEPSAGKGDIVDALRLHGAKDVIACEINADLKKIVQTKCRVIAEDFLTVRAEDISHIDAIVMNPPFSADEQHIIHAFEIAPPGCEIIALCNWETYNHAYNSRRRMFKYLVNEHGHISNLGNCFSSSERQTDVEIGLVKLLKPGSKGRDEFEGFFMDEEPEEMQSNGIMPYNFVRELVNRYVAAVKLFDEQMDVGIRMHNLTNTFFSGKMAFTCTSEGAPLLRNEFKKDLQKGAWKWVFNQMKMEKYTTKGLKEDINKFVEQQQQVPFTMKNIYKMIEIVIGTTSSRMDRAIIEVFDKLTSHYHDNRYNVEGWKTNSHYLMGEKFILPGMTNVDYGYMRVRWDGWFVELVEDMVKAICYITGTNYDNIKSLYSFLQDLDKPEWNTWYDWHFFEIKGFKKGTMHFKFKDRNVWALFNQHVARIKGYPLPEAVRKAA